MNINISPQWLENKDKVGTQFSNNYNTEASLIAMNISHRYIDYKSTCLVC